VDDGREPDLFWAIRGGGGNLGVVTRLRFRLHPEARITGGMLLLPATPGAVAGAMRLLDEAPEALSGIVNVMPCPPLPFVPPEHHGAVVILALLCFAGPDEEAAAALAPLRALATPVADLVRPMAYPELYPPDSPDYHPLAVSRTLFLDAFDEDDARMALDRLAALDAPMRVLQLRALGGASARVPVEATAYAHRDRRFMVNVAAFYADDADRTEKVAWVESLARDLGPAPGAYVNFLADEGPDRVRAAYPGTTWDRLAEIKRRYDPENLFHHTQNVPPAGA
jgi:FAD/FMN-containing dehydrogenase